MQHPFVFSLEWFRKHQKKLLWFANTFIGRVILRIHGDRSSVGSSEITKIEPNAITWQNADGTYSTEFRTHAKFSKRLYYAFKSVWYAMHWWDEIVANNLDKRLDFGFATLTEFPEPFDSLVAEDGTAWYFDTELTWSDIVSASGSSSNVNNATDSFAKLRTGTTTGRWDFLVRGIFAFDTSSLTNEATIDAATLSLYGSAKSDDNSMADANKSLALCEMDSPSPDAVSSVDYALAFTSRVVDSDLSYGTFSTSGYNTFTLNTDGENHIDKTGVTEFATRFTCDVDITTPNWGDANNLTNIDGHFADETGTSQDPKLEVTYHIDTSVAASTQSISLNQQSATASGGAVTSVSEQSFTFNQNSASTISSNNITVSSQALTFNPQSAGLSIVSYKTDWTAGSGVSTNWAEDTQTGTDWTTDYGADSTISAGTPIGLLLSLTYATNVEIAGTEQSKTNWADDLITGTDWTEDTDNSTNWSS